MSAPTTSNPGGSRELIRTLILAAALIAAWLLWSGLYKPLLIGLGAFSCAVIVVLARRMHYFNNELFALKYGAGILGYWLWLGKEIVLSSLDVAKVILRRDMNLAPVVITVDADKMTVVDQVVFGNSITLTPGTLTLDVYEDKITVHALTQEGAETLQQGEMQRRVRALRKD